MSCFDNNNNTLARNACEWVNIPMLTEQASMPGMSKQLDWRIPRQGQIQVRRARGFHIFVASILLFANQNITIRIPTPGNTKCFVQHYLDHIGKHGCCNSASWRADKLPIFYLSASDLIITIWRACWWSMRIDLPRLLRALGFGRLKLTRPLSRNRALGGGRISWADWIDRLSIRSGTGPRIVGLRGCGLPTLNIFGDF